MEKRVLLVMVIFVMLCGGVGFSRTVVNNKIYTAPAGTNSDPGSGSPWIQAPGGQVSLPFGQTISIGLTNLAIEENKKTVTISFTGNNADDKIRITGASGTDGSGQGVKTHENAVGHNPIIERTTYQYTFDPQPEYEIFQVTNIGGSGCTFDVEAMSSCRQVREPDVAVAEAEENKIVIMPIVIQQDDNATITIDEVAIWPKDATTDSNEPGEFVPPIVSDPCSPSDPYDSNTPTGTWGVVSFGHDPETGEPLPQGGWKWSCEPTDRGIWETEEFGLSITTESLAGGEYWFAVHDRQRDEWIRFLFEEDQVTHLRGDLTEDGSVNINDFALFSAQWLSEGREQCYVIWSVVCPNCDDFTPEDGKTSKSKAKVYEEDECDEVTKGSGSRGDQIIRTRDLGGDVVITWTYECNDDRPCCGGQIDCFGTVTMIPEGVGHTAGAKIDCECP